MATTDPGPGGSAAPRPAATAEPDSIPGDIRVLIAAAFVIALGYGLVAPVLPQFARSFDVGVAAASFIVSVFAFMRLVFAPAGGALVGRFGERRVYLAGLVIVALSTGACAFAQSYPELVVYRGLGGIGSTMFTISAMGLIVRLAPPSMRGRVSSAYGGAFLVGNVAGPLLGAAAAGLGQRLPFVIYGVALLVAVAIVAVRLSEANLRPAPGTPTLPVMTLREGWADPAYRALLVSSFANGWSNFGVRVATVPLFAAAAPAIGSAWAGVALTVFALGNVVVLRWSGRWADSRGRRPYVVAGLAVSGIGMALVSLTHEVAPFLVTSFVAGLGAGLLAPPQQAALADVVGAQRTGGPVIAAFQMVSDLGGIVGPVVAGAVADAAGFPAAFLLTGAVLVAGALAWIPAPETLRRDVPPVPAAGSGIE